MKDKYKLFLIIFILVWLFFSPSKVWAQEETPPPLITQEIKSAKGARFNTGWNYFSIEDENCTVKKILDELQADGGGALIANALWIKEGEDWVRHEFSEETEDTTLIDSHKTYAFFSNVGFFFDLASSVCIKKDSQREQQILGLRAVKNKELAAKKSLLEKIVTLPFEFWQNFWDMAMGKKKEGKIENVSLPFENNVVIEKDLMVLGESTVSDLGVTGSITAGLLSIDGLESEIASLTGPVKITSLTNFDNSNILEVGDDLFNFDSLGNLEIAEGVIIGNEKMRNALTIPAGSTSFEFRVSDFGFRWSETPASVVVTPTWETKFWVENISETGFTINFGTGPWTEKEVYWLAIW